MVVYKKCQIHKGDVQTAGHVYVTLFIYYTDYVLNCIYLKLYISHCVQYTLCMQSERGTNWGSIVEPTV